MAGELPKKIEEFNIIKGSKVAIISGQWHREIAEVMVKSAIDVLKKIGLDDDSILVHWAPGSLELPLYASLLLKNDPSLDGVIAFGVVLQGATTHNESVVQSVVDGFTELSLKYNKPIINEVIGVKDLKDAVVRAESKGVEAVFAFSEVVGFVRSLAR